jgi:hypothetical protein
MNSVLLRFVFGDSGGKRTCEVKLFIFNNIFFIMVRGTFTLTGMVRGTFTLAGIK